MSQGIQNNNVQKIDLVYTKLGRFLKSINSPDAEITKFALSDDGIDYNNYDINLPEDQRDLKIKRTAQFDAWTDQDSIMKNKLVSLQRDTTERTKLKVNPKQISFSVDPNTSTQFEVETVTVNTGYATPNGFNVRLSDSKYVSMVEATTVEEVDFPNQPPIMLENANMMMSNQQSTGSNSRKNNLFFDGGNGNKEPQTLKLHGSNNAPTIVTFRVYYNESGWRKFDLGNTYRTKLTVESIDSGEVKEVEIVLTTETNNQL